jgi:hypothetical protein
MRGWFLLYGTFRLLLWSAAVALALFPTIWAVDGSLDHSLLWRINVDGRFRDLFFLLAPAAGLSLTTTLDFIWADHISATARNAAILALLANFVVLLSGFVGFLMIPDESVLVVDQFATYSWVIAGGLILTLATELWISLASERRRKLLDRNWNDAARVRERLNALRRGTAER